MEAAAGLGTTNMSGPSPLLIQSPARHAPRKIAALAPISQLACRVQHKYTKPLEFCWRCDASSPWFRGNHGASQLNRPLGTPPGGLARFSTSPNTAEFRLLPPPCIQLQLKPAPGPTGAFIVALWQPPKHRKARCDEFAARLCLVAFT